MEFRSLLRLCHGLAWHCSTVRIGPLPHWWLIFPLFSLFPTVALLTLYFPQNSPDYSCPTLSKHFKIYQMGIISADMSWIFSRPVGFVFSKPKPCHQPGNRLLHRLFPLIDPLSSEWSHLLKRLHISVYGHIMLKTPVLVWSLKLSNIEPC